MEISENRGGQMKSKWWLISLLACLLIASLAPLASSSPDGLERIAEDKGFAGMGQSSPFSLITDYVFPGVANQTLATILAGTIGTLLLFAIVYGIAWLLNLKTKKPTVAEPTE
jgi:hypothetical protein